MLVKTAKELIQSSFIKAGLEIRRKTEEEFFDLTRRERFHPIEAIFAARGKPCLVKVPLDRLVTFNYSAFSLTPNGGHPFLKTLESYKDNPEISAEHSPLGRYYDLYQPRNASELMDIDSPSYSDFDSLPPLAATPLFTIKSPEEYLSHIKGVYKKEDIEQGARVDKFIGGSEFGPIDQRKLAIEFTRLTGLYDSIKQHGYLSEKCEWMTGTAWIGDDDDWVVAISTGQHRLACLAALGYTSATVLLQPQKAPGGIMMRAFSRHFPTVFNGFHTQEEALAIFDRILRQQPPKAAREWLAYCRNPHVPLPIDPNTAPLDYCAADAPRPAARPG